MGDAYHGFELVVVSLAVGLAGWRVWKAYAPKKRAAETAGCDAGCPSCNHCTTTDAAPPPGVTPRPRRAEQPLVFRPRRR